MCVLHYPFFSLYFVPPYRWQICILNSKPYKAVNMPTIYLVGGYSNNSSRKPEVTSQISLMCSFFQANWVLIIVLAQTSSWCFLRIWACRVAETLSYFTMKFENCEKTCPHCFKKHNICDGSNYSFYVLGEASLQSSLARLRAGGRHLGAERESTDMWRPRGGIHRESETTQTEDQPDSRQER